MNRLFHAAKKAASSRKRNAIPPFPANSRMKEERLSPHAVAGGMAVTGTQENDVPFPCSGFTGLPPAFFQRSHKIHTSRNGNSPVLHAGKGSPYGYGAKKAQQTKGSFTGNQPPPNRAEAAATHPFYCTRIVCSISSFRRGAVMPPTISFSFIPSRYRTVRGTASRPYLRAMSG